MICTLNRIQKETTLKLVGRLVQINKVISPEEILKNVYNVVFESFTKKNRQKDAEPYAFAMTQYAADNLYLILETEKEEIRDLLSKVLGTEKQFSLENIEKYRNEDELRKLLGLKSDNLEIVKSSVSRQDVQKYLDRIALTFPPIQDKVTYVRSDYPYSAWNFPIAKTKDGTIIKLPSVTDFLNINTVKNVLSSDNRKTRAGTLTDLVIRKYFQNPISYEVFTKNILQDKEFIDTFLRFSENRTIPSQEVTPTTSRYMEEYIKDMMYAINFIQTNYQDAYITDFGDLVEKSALSPEEKKKFYIYSAEIGLRGELDLIAIKPDGTFTVVDTKTTDGYTTNFQENKHGKQASIYDLIISSVHGLKSSGVNEIIYLTTFMTNPTKVMGSKDVGNYRLSITDFNKKTNKNISPDLLLKEIHLYKKQIDDAYTKTETVKDINQEIKPLTPFSPINMIKGRKKPGDDKSLKMTVDSNMELSTRESLEEGKQWLHSVFPELDEQSVQIQRIANSPVGGEFFLDVIKLYELSNEGVAYHEGWHRFSQLYMTKKQKTDLYTSVQKDNIDFTTRDGRSLNTSTASFLDIEEMMAEEFRKYVKNPESYSFPKGNSKPKSWFRRIWEAIKAIANWFKSNGSFSYNDLFEQLYTGSFNRTNFSTKNSIFNQLNSFFVDTNKGRTTILDNNTFLRFRDFTDYTLNQYLSVNDITITDLLTSDGLRELNVLVRDTLSIKKNEIEAIKRNLETQFNETEDEAVKEKITANIESLGFFQNALDIILQQNENGDYINFADFMRAYFKTSEFQSLRKFIDKNQDISNSIVNEENLADYEKQEETGEELDDFDEKPQSTDDFEFNMSGNEKEAIKNAKDEMKDFFGAIPRRKNSDLVSELDDSMYEFDKFGLPVTLSKQEAFYKTLRVLQGSLTWEMIIQRLNTPNNYIIFPELLSIKEKLLGSSKNEGLVPKMQRLSKIMIDGVATEEEIKEHTKLLSFLMHFAHVMSLRSVDFDTFIIKTNYSQEDDNVRTVSPLQTRENYESIIFSIVNDFTKGFQLNTEKKFMNSDRSYINVYEAMYNIFTKGEEGLVNFLTSFGSKEFIYDPQYKRFLFNSMYIFKKFDTTNPSDREMKDFFTSLGINLNDKIYENQNDRKELLYVYRRLRDIIWAFHRNTGDKIARLYNTTKITDLVNNWKLAKDNSENSQLEGVQKFLANQALMDAEISLRGYVNNIFSFNPVEQMLFDGRDRDLMLSNSRNRIFGANEMLFRQLAKIEKNYHKRFSSGSMIVVDKLQYSNFLPNNMLVTEMLINDHINHISDFSKYPELSHLDPIKNPAILNSVIFQKIFAQDGTKRPNIKLGVSIISQISQISPSSEVESKTVQQLNEDEKILTDFLMVISEGSSEIRRLEASNSAYRLSIKEVEGNVKRYIKPIKITLIDKFANPTFLNIVRGYIQHAAWKWQYNQDEDTRKLDVNYANKDSLGIFDEMLPLSSTKIKSFILEEGGDMNTLMERIESKNPELFTQINKEIVNYFEEIAITNPDSYKNLFNTKLSEKSRALISNLASIQSPKTLISTDYLGNVDENLFRDFIANDFIQTMEDSLLFFGDYTYYKDPIKRRKIIGNNGSIHIVDNIINQAITAQKQNNSITHIYQKAKNITSTKDNRLIRKTIVNDVKMNSKLLDRDEEGRMELIKKLSLVFKQEFATELSDEQLEEMYKDTIDAFTDIEVGDAAAWINLDTYRLMRMREMTWDLDKDEAEYNRQQLILKRNLNEELTEQELDFINRGPYSGFNVAKYAMTGPIYSNSSMPFKPGFDKMGLRPLLPELDWNRTTRPLFETIMKNDLDYMVFDTGSKVYKPPISKAFSNTGLKNVLNEDSMVYSEHAGGYFKYQQNTTQANDKSTFSVQLRSIFYEIMLILEKNGKVSPELKNAYSKVIKSLSDYITINSSRSLTEMGLDITGKIRDRSTFINYLKERLLNIGGVDEELIDLLNVNNNGEIATFLEALPFQKNIADLIAGIIDDNFRKIKLNGTKFYQSPEIGTTIPSKKIEDLPKSERGTIELNWHDLEIVDGKVISTTPVECKINFRDQFRPLLNMKHRDGEKIMTLKRLNESIQDKEWVNSNKDSIIFIGVRIPLQDINFNSHIIVREFLPETVGDMIILPPEFYKQTGSDNDIDTVTATFKYLDDNGRPIKRPKEEFTDIVNKINELSTEIGGTINIVNDQSLENNLQDLKQVFIENNIYVNKQAGLDVMNRDFTIVEVDGFRTLSGLMDRKSVLYKIIKNGEYSEQVDMVMNFVQSLNNVPRAIKSDSKKELASLIKKRNNYIKGITNDMVNSIIEFAKSPATFAYLAQTDSITKITEFASEIISIKTGKPVDQIKLGQTQSSLQAMSYNMNVINHKNNFEIRSILGSVVKFRSTMSLLDKIDTVLQKDYIAGSMINLIKRKSQESSFAESVQKKLDKTYQRTIYTPLLYKKDTSKGIAISIYDENGERITKNLSMLASSLLDLFKNVDIFPSLGITWLNVKPLIFLSATGVPMRRALLFLNNPIVQEVQAELNRLGANARDRHALVSVAQKFSAGEIFGMPSDMLVESDTSNRELYSENVFSVKILPTPGGVAKINTKMRRPGKAAELYLGGKHLKFSEEDIINFTKDYNTYINDPERSSYTKSFEFFLRTYPQYNEVAKDIVAYYATLLEDGDIFYSYFVKGLNRNSAKLNSNAAIATSKSVQKARITSGIANPEFEERLEKESTHSPFFKDEIIQNVLSNIMPNILDNPDNYFRTKFKEVVENITSQTFGTPEDKRKVEMRVLSDFIEMIYKNFYILKDSQSKGNTLYEYFQNDITPLLGPLTQGIDNYKKFVDEFSKQKEAILSEDTKIQNLYSESLFGNQIELLKAKYPELRNIKFVDELLSKKEHGRDPQKESNMEHKDILNMLSQSYIIVNMSTNPNEKMDEEQIMRDEWKKLIEFSLSQFPTIEAEVAQQGTDRIDFYENKDNILEIRKFFTLLAYYSLAQSSHIEKSRAAFSYLAPPHIIKDVVEKSIKNFNRYIMTAGSMFDNMGIGNEEVRKEAIDKLLFKFQKMFKDMNSDLKWQDPTPVVKKQAPSQVEEGDEMWGTEDMIYYSPKKKRNDPGLPYMKSHTGKLYSKIEDPNIEFFKKKLQKEEDVEMTAMNTFRIQIFNNQGDPLNCSK